ncbi:MAG: Peptidyl-prolyl cis-trans isomerase B [Firmicutes bacterium]|nr:Peptidyl-prolyl cis-trans isomerase B [Bacillota bacterium]
MQNKQLVILETEKGNFTIELFAEAAPGTVANFTKLIDAKFYDGLTFHRCLPNFVIQGGCPDGSGRSGPGYQIKCETAGNPHKHLRGALSMAHAGKDTGGSQFFIVRQPQPHLDGKHTVFGQVVDNVDLVDAIEQGDRMLCVRMVSAADSSNTPQE